MREKLSLLFVVLWFASKCCSSILEDGILGHMLISTFAVGKLLENQDKPRYINAVKVLQVLSCKMGRNMTADDSIYGRNILVSTMASILEEARVVMLMANTYRRCLSKMPMLTVYQKVR